MQNYRSGLCLTVHINLSESVFSFIHNVLPLKVWKDRLETQAARVLEGCQAELLLAILTFY